MRLATYNIHACIGNDGRFNPARILDVLLRLDADVIGLQEVEARPHGGSDVLAYLASSTAMSCIAGPTLERANGNYGNALLTRLPIREIQRFDLSATGQEPRGGLDVDIEWNSTPVRVINTHLGLRSRERSSQMDALLARVRSRQGGQLALLGDFNEWFPWSRPLTRLRRFFGALSAPASYPARWPLCALDRIWLHNYRSIGRVKAVNTAMTRTASDHLPVCVDVEW
jgi:endonuclease/exonuclease/phosphatase family metal-dependent hydrolase